MSLLEDIFLQDEANEALELERVIEGGDYEERIISNSDNDSEKEDEAEEEKRRVDPTSTKTKRVVKNPRFILNPARLTGPRGIHVIPEHFKDFKFKGKGHEKEDLDLVLKKLEHWAYRLYPKFKFEDCLKKIETLGKKRPVMVHLQKIRSDQFISDDTVVQKDSSDEETQPEPDEFDKLLQEQIELARATPVAVDKTIDTSLENRSMHMPKAPSSPSISDEQRERILQNRRLAEERRLAKLNNLKINTSVSETTNKPDGNNLKQGQINDIDSSDEEITSEVIRIEVQTHKHDEPVQRKNERDNNLLHRKQNSNSMNSSHDRAIDVDKAHSDEDIQSQAKKRKTNIIDSSEDESNIIEDKIDFDNGENKKIVKYTRENTPSNEKINDLSDVESSSKQTENEPDATGINVSDVVLENSIIQRTIQGLVENDNNINLERDLNNQANINTQNLEESEEFMDIDFSKEFD